MIQLLTQTPDPKHTMDFLERGGSFALLCVILIAMGAAMFFAGRALFKLLREFLTDTVATLKAIKDGQAAANEVLKELTNETKAMRSSADATAEIVVPWGSPEWLKLRLTELERRLEAIAREIAVVKSKLSTGTE